MPSHGRPPLMPHASPLDRLYTLSRLRLSPAKRRHLKFFLGLFSLTLSRSVRTSPARPTPPAGNAFALGLALASVRQGIATLQFANTLRPGSLNAGNTLTRRSGHRLASLMQVRIPNDVSYTLPRRHRSREDPTSRGDPVGPTPVSGDIAASSRSLVHRFTTLQTVHRTNVPTPPARLRTPYRRGAPYGDCWNQSDTIGAFSWPHVAPVFARRGHTRRLASVVRAAAMTSL
jgi:hypothetical protein